MGEPGAVVERGVWAASAEAWDVAVRRAGGDRPARWLRCGGSPRGGRCGCRALGVSRRQVYALLGRWREGSGLVSGLVRGRSSGGRGREHLPEAVEAVIRGALRTPMAANGNERANG